jgi:hypothetical protein
MPSSFDSALSRIDLHHHVVRVDPAIGTSRRTTRHRLQHVPVGPAPVRSGLARPDGRSCITLVNRLHHQCVAGAALLHNGCSAAADHLPARTGGRSTADAWICSTTADRCRTTREQCPHVTVGVAAPRGTISRTPRAPLRHQEGRSAAPIGIGYRRIWEKMPHLTGRVSAASG